MRALNFYFTPFAVILTIFAVYFSSLDGGTAAVTFSVLLAGFVINWWLGKNEYRFFRWLNAMRAAAVAVNLATSAVIFYLIGSYWAPSWLLFTIAPAGAAMYMNKWKSLSVAMISVILLLSVYYLKSRFFGFSLGEIHWAMASVHGIFIVVFTMLLNSMAQTAVKIRDAMLRK